jgi:hypothetical protein
MTRKDRIEQIKKQLEVLSGGPVTFVASKEMSEEAQEQFLLEILDYHSTDKTTPPDPPIRGERKDRRH